MRIGFTFDLKADYIADGLTPEEAAEFDKEDTVVGIEQALVGLGHEVERIGRLRRLVRRLADGASWDLVFNIAEGLSGFARESQIPALLDGYGIPYVFSDPLTLSLALHKGYCKHVFRDLALATPRFAVAENAADLERAADLAFPVFVKPVAEGTGKGVSPRGKAGDMESLRRVGSELIAKFRQPVLVEEYLPGREFTVGVVGTGPAARIIAVMEVLLLGNAEQGAYSYDNKDKYEDRVKYVLADDPEALAAGELALAAYRGIGCRDAGRVDLRSDAEGLPQLMEINPLAGLNPTHSDLPIMCRLAGIGFDRLIGMIVASAAERLGAGAWNGGG